MSLRVLHLASINYTLKHQYKNSICPDPLALVNLGDLVELGKEKATSFLERVLIEFTTYNPVDDLAIRTAVSSIEEYRYKRPFKLYLKPKNHKHNVLHAYEVCRVFAQQNPDMKLDEAWLIFGMSIPELFSGNVCSDTYWPDEVIMEVTSGALAPLARGEIVKPETWVLKRDTGTIYCRKGSNSPVLEKFIGKELKITKIKQIMTFAARRPCTLEFVYGYVRKIHDFVPLIIDVRVLSSIEWDFCGTKAIWKVSNSRDFFRMLSSISYIAAKHQGLIKKGNFVLVTSPEGSAIDDFSRKVGLRSLFDIEIFSPDYRTFATQPLL